MNIHVCHCKTMSHPLKYLRYWIRTNIIHINHNTKFVQFLYAYENQILHEICTNLWSLVKFWCGFCDRFKIWLLFFSTMFIITWSQKNIMYLQRTSKCHVASWFCDYDNQYDNLFNFWANILLLLNLYQYIWMI
jgi:hypothetical protein